MAAAGLILTSPQKQGITILSATWLFVDRENLLEFFKTNPDRIAIWPIDSFLSIIRFLLDNDRHHLDRKLSDLKSSAKYYSQYIKIKLYS